MATFIVPNVGKTHRDYIGEQENHPVNIDLCTQLQKMELPNGYGKKYPAIVFQGCDAIWYYDEKGHELRDKMYHQILQRFGGNK